MADAVAAPPTPVSAFAEAPAAGAVTARVEAARAAGVGVPVAIGAVAISSVAVTGATVIGPMVAATVAEEVPVDDTRRVWSA